MNNITLKWALAISLLKNNKSVQFALCALFAFGGLLPLKATTYRSSLGTGKWSTGSNWGSSGSGTPVVYKINSGHTITLDVNVSGLDTLIISGTLNFGNSKVLTMNANGVVFVFTGGHISGGNNNSQFNWTSSSAVVDGPFNGSNEIIGGMRFGTSATAIAAGGDPQLSFPNITPLPISLIHFEVDHTGDNYTAYWTAEGHGQDAMFVVSVSSDALAYHDVYTCNVMSEGTPSNYSAALGKVDKAIFVKLEAVENGVRSELNILLVKAPQQDAAGAKIFPTVISQNTGEVHLVVPASGNYTIRIFDASLKNVEDINLSIAQANQVVAIPNLASHLANGGVYYVQVMNSEGFSYRTPIVVQK